MSQEIKKVKIVGTYIFSGQTKKLELLNQDYEDGLVSGEGEDSRGYYKVSGVYGAIVGFKLEYVDKHTIIFQGSANEKQHSEGTSKIENKNSGTYSLDLIDMPKETKKEPIKEVVAFANGRKMDIEVQIITPEKAKVKIPVRLDQTMGSLKDQILKIPKFFNLEDAISTKTFKSDNKKYDTKIGTIGGQHPIIHFSLCPSMDDQKNGNLKKTIPKQYNTTKSSLHLRHMDGFAFENDRTLEYYKISNGTTFYMHLEYLIDVVCFEMGNKLETNGLIIARVPKDPVYPRYHIKVFPTDTIAQVKRKCYDYLKNAIRQAYSKSDDSLKEKESMLQIDLDKIRPEKWMLVKDGSYTALVEARPLEYYLIQGLTRFEMKKHDCQKILNSAHISNVDGKTVLKDFEKTTKLKKDKSICKQIEESEDEYPLTVVMITEDPNETKKDPDERYKPNRQKKVLVRPGTKVSKLKKIIVQRLKEQRNIEITPGDFWLNSIDKMLSEYHTCKEMKQLKFTEVFIMLKDGEML